MSYHILHLLSHNLRVRCKLDQLQITDSEKGTERTVPLADIAVIVAAAKDLSLTAGALRRMAELNVLLLVCNEKFEPCSITLPYYRATNTELLRRQIEWAPVWKERMWRQIITDKIRNQATVLSHLKRTHAVLTEIAERCANGAKRLECGDSSPLSPGARLSSAVADPPADNVHASECMPTSPSAASGDTGTPQSAGAPVHSKVSLASITPAKRAGLHANTPEACESRAARHYWKHLLPRLSEWQQTDEKRRMPGTREGVNGMLDYGYAILRTAVLRSLAAHGFIAAIGIAHTPKAGSFSLADDLMEPLRPWIDRELRQFVQGGSRPMEEWMRQAVSVLQLEVVMSKTKVRLLNAIDLYVQSFATAALSRAPLPLRIPLLT
jgi:CRISPR/Cas system-associated endonuclease Cas1